MFKLRFVNFSINEYYRLQDTIVGATVGAIVGASVAPTVATCKRYVQPIVQLSHCCKFRPGVKSRAPSLARTGPPMTLKVKVKGQKKSAVVATSTEVNSSSTLHLDKRSSSRLGLKELLLCE